MKLGGFAYEIFKDKYAAPGETEWEQCARRVANHIAQAESTDQAEWADKFFSILKDQDFCCGGRVLYGAGRPRQSMLNCFCLIPEDNANSLGDLLRDAYLISVQGGGIGMNFSNIRPKGDDIQSIKYSAPGTVSEMRKINSIAQEVRGGKNRRCLRKGTKVLTINGFDNIENIKPGELVATNNGWSRVLENIYQGKQSIVRVYHQDGYIDCTSNHRIAVLQDINGNFIWKKANDLVNGDKLFYIRNRSYGQKTFLPPRYNPGIHHNSKSIIIPKLDEDMAWFLGAFAGDGSVPLCKREIGYINISAHSEQKEYINKLYNQFCRFGIHVSIQKNKNENCCSIRGFSKELAEYFHKYIKIPFENITIPDFIRKANQSIKMAYIAGVVDADGCFNNVSRIVSTVYLDFAKEIQSLLYSCGIESRLNIGKLFNSRPSNWKLLHHVVLINKSSRIAFKEQTNKYIIKKIPIQKQTHYSNSFPGKWIKSTNVSFKNKIANNINISIDRLENDLKYSLKYIPFDFKSINDLGEVDDTYDLSVENDACFIADGILVHNSAFLSILDIRHPDILEFLQAKNDRRELNNFNISIGITNNFLQCVEKNKEWNFTFNNRDYFVYEVDRIDVNNNTKDIIRLTALNEDDAIGRCYGHYKKDWNTIFKNARKIKYTAKELWENIIKNAYECGEPGIYNKSFSNAYTNVSYFMTMNCTNPCGEISLENGGSCNLGSINLSNMYDTTKNDVNWKKLAKTLKIAVRMLDNIITINNFPIPLTRDQAIKTRRIGIGVMGLAHLLIRMNLRYGSEASLEFLERLFTTLRNEVYSASIDLAEEKGSFINFDNEKFLQEDFAKTLPQRIRRRIKKSGIRSALLLTIPPTGTISLLCECSSGIEPIFAQIYRRHYRDPQDGNVLKNKIVVDKLFYEFYRNNKNIDHIVGSHQITPEEHLAVQATVQKFIDQNISKTINLSNNIDIKKLSNIIFEYISEIKGLTLYRAGSRGKEPLEIIDVSNKKELDKIIKEAEIETYSINSCKSGKCDI